MNNKMIVIVGATASQKSQLALKIAQDINSEIINADSFQVYKELNAGINKPTIQEQQLVKHHLIDCVSIYNEFDLKVYQTLCQEQIKKLHDNNIIPILCGGSNLYIDAVIKGYDLDKANGRNYITYFDNWTYDQIYNYVLEHDQNEASKIDYNNKQRIIRAAQIIYATSDKKSALDNQKNQYIYDCLIIETFLERDILYEKINNRVEKMVQDGWFDEVKDLYEKDHQIVHLQAFCAIGYKQMLNAILTKQPLDVEMIKQKTRQFAKKQMTWNRNKYNDIIKFDINNGNYAVLLITIKEFIGK